LEVSIMADAVGTKTASKTAKSKAALVKKPVQVVIVPAPKATAKPAPKATAKPAVKAAPKPAAKAAPKSKTPAKSAK
jgi:hypothetical protein